MAFVRIEQRNAHLAGKVRLDNVNSPAGKLARAVHLRPGRAHQPLRTLQVYPDHRRAARPAP